MTNDSTPLFALGLRDNPFAEYVAENEPNLDKYLVAPPYVADCLDRASKSRSFLLFGARGAGKSATRIAVARDAWPGTAGKSKTLVVTMDDFGWVLDGSLNNATTDRLVQQAGFLVVQGVLLWLSALEEEDRAVYLDARDDDEVKLCVGVVEEFYLSRHEAVRKISASKAAQLLQYSVATKTGLWAKKRWSALAEVVAHIALAIAKRKLDVESDGAAPALKEVMVPKARMLSAKVAGHERSTLERLVEFCRVFGFSGVTVLVDKADETQQTSNSAESTAKLLYPLLSNVQLVEVEGFAWGFFLWDRVRTYYSDGPLKVRIDKIPSVEIRWDNHQLVEMLDKRVDYFSDGSVPRLSDLVGGEGQPAGDDEAMFVPAVRLLVDVAMRSPRAAIRVMDSVLKEHVELVQNGKVDSNRQLPGESVERGLDRYCTTTIRDGFDDGVLQQILKLGKTVFANKDVQETFRIGSESARAKIQRWVDAGLVDRTGTRPAEGDSGGKPAYEYSIVETRLRRIVERALSLGTQFDLGLEALDAADDADG